MHSFVTVGLSMLQRKHGTMRTHLPAKLFLSQRIVACLLLALVAFVVVNPLWECHDHLDNLRHLGSNGFLLIILLVACAGISLLKPLHWFSLHLLRDSLSSPPQSFATPQQACDKLLCVLTGDLLLPLRI